MNSLTSDNISWDMTSRASLTTCDAYGYGEYEIYSMTQQRQSEQMSHFQMLLLLGSNTVGHILKQHCDVVYNGNLSLKLLASGFHYECLFCIPHTVIS